MLVPEYDGRILCVRRLITEELRDFLAWNTRSASYYEDMQEGIQDEKIQ